MEAAYQGSVPSRSTSPTITELPKLQQELGLWMAHTRYQAQPPDQLQIWRVQNTSITLSTGMGIASFFFFKRVNPAAKFPLDIIPPFIMFYFSHRAAQVGQLPQLYESFLSLTTPLGFKAREVLAAIRENGRLPSQEFGTQLPKRPSAPGGAGAPPVAPPPAPQEGFHGGISSFDAAAPSVQPETWGDSGSFSSQREKELSSQDGGGGDFSSAAPAAWGDPGAAVTPGGSQGWGDFPAAPGGAPDEQKGPPQRKTWDEIRAEAARRQQQQPSE